MFKETLLGVVAAGSVGYFAADPVLKLPQDHHYHPASKTVITASSSSEVDAMATAFVHELREYKMSVRSGTHDNERMLMYRDRIRSAFEGAYGAIEAIEQSGDLASTETARELMQKAIAEYMERDSAEASPQITRDLGAYSRFLTETLIARSLLVTETTQ